jgi:hypothetical protein
MILKKGIKPFLYLFFVQALRAFSERRKKAAARLQANPINLQKNFV